MKKNTYEKIGGGIQPIPRKQLMPVRFPMGATTEALWKVLHDWPELDRDDDLQMVRIDKGGLSSAVKCIYFGDERHTYDGGLSIRAIKILLATRRRMKGEVKVDTVDGEVVSIRNFWPLDRRELDDGSQTAEIIINAD